MQMLALILIVPRAFPFLKILLFAHLPQNATKEQGISFGSFQKGSYKLNCGTRGGGSQLIESALFG